MKLHLTTTAALCALAASTPAFAAPGDPVKLSDSVTIDPIVEGRLRYENVDTPSLDADALTMRLRAGFELKHASGLSVLAEAEGSLALIDDYNAFPFTIANSQRRPGFAVVGDPMTVELNRLQLQYKGKAGTLTAGRQRINLDDQRWVGAVGWRQNEQTFDAVRAEAKLGPVSIDATYANSQRTIWGIEAGPRRAFDGDFGFLGAGARVGPAQVKAFAYLLDYDAAEQVGTLAAPNADTQTYGARATAAFKLSKTASLALAASYARQFDWQDNPADYGADYVAGEAALAVGPVTLTGGYEKLGSDNGRAVQSPMATLHKFNGWADLFLTTPAAGLEDFYAGAAMKFPKFKALPGLNAAVTWHRFESDAGSLHYGEEWDASLGFKLGRANLLAKFADYNAANLGADTRKLWLQVEFAY
ncbi:alginate export protein [Novosphingobium kunmingense]|uniref:Alginate export protein n=1 Tax=Novosphingobium kunmingense TaxID=1211806 RepID=A0A2N0H6A6_9SPHN|nr:alginate export family protein [Novosphingobium kunmingense]PKB14457.1 alginate export protein [Novosphingobium kunmingense]